jgi:hypothetical protein
MRRILPLMLTMLLLAAAHAYSQTTPTQIWLRIVPAESPGITVTLPAGSTIRWCDTATGKTCSPAESFSSPTTAITAYCPFVTACSDADTSDGLNGVTKDIEVLEIHVPLTVSVNTNGAIAAVVVPAAGVPVAAPSTYPPFAFKPGVSYSVSVSNIPPATPTSPLQGLMTVKYGDTVVVSFVCAYGTTMPIAAPAGASPSLAALFGCVPVPLP